MTNVWKRLACCLAVLGLIVPQQVFAADSGTAASDVRIAGGVLAGRVVTASGQPAVTTIAVFQGNTEIARTQSNAAGVYRIRNLRAGAYTVVTPTSAVNVRVWDAAAPAKALNSLTLTDRPVVRGQFCDTGCDNSCDGCGPTGGHGKALLGVALVAGVATAVAVAVANDDDSPSSP